MISFWILQCWKNKAGLGKPKNFCAQGLENAELFPKSSSEMMIDTLKEKNCLHLSIRSMSEIPRKAYFPEFSTEIVGKEEKIDHIS